MMRTVLLVSVLLASVGVVAGDGQFGAPNQTGVTLLAFTCTAVSGAALVAPEWKPDVDGMKDQSVLRLRYRGDRQVSEVAWGFGMNAPYYEAKGVGSQMKSGFAIIVTGDETVETYVYNAPNAELLYSSIRSGSAVLPNRVQAFRGVCRTVPPLLFWPATKARTDIMKRDMELVRTLLFTSLLVKVASNRFSAS
jgi:hypothetical protein